MDSENRLWLVFYCLSTMNDVQRLGRAWAWLDGEQWRYILFAEFAPEGAIEVEQLLVDGQVVLYHTTGNTAQFIRGAVKAGRE